MMRLIRSKIHFAPYFPLTDVVFRPDGRAILSTRQDNLILAQDKGVRG